MLQVYKREGVVKSDTRTVVAPRYGVAVSTDVAGPDQAAADAAVNC